MRRAIGLSVAWSLLTLVLSAAESSKLPERARSPSPLAGSWEMITTSFIAQKHLTPTHFIWVHLEPKTKKIIRSMGGTYKQEGDDYTETIEFTSPEFADHIGTKAKFRVKIEGDKWIQTSPDVPQAPKEVWTRLSVKLP